MRRDVSLLLDDVLENINLIEDSLHNRNKEEFLKDRTIQDATVRRLEIIGEATKNIPLNIKEKHPEMEWKKVAGTRDIIIHTYFVVDLDLVWDIINKDIPILKKQIEKIKRELEKE